MDTHGYYVQNGKVYGPEDRLVANIPGPVDRATSAGLEVVRELARLRAEMQRAIEAIEKVRNRDAAARILREALG